MSAIAIPTPHHDPAALGLHASGTLSLTRSSYSHWRKRRGNALRAIIGKLKPVWWPEAPQGRKTSKAEAEHRRAYERAARKGRDQRRRLQAILMAIYETDRRITAATDEAVRSFALAASILRGEPVPRAARRDTDTQVVREAARLRDEIDALGLADGPAVHERIAALLGDLERQEGEAKAALTAIARQFEEDHALMEKVGAKAAFCFARTDAHQPGLSDEAADLHAQKMQAAWRAA